jgi:hypothetical protein
MQRTFTRVTGTSTGYLDWRDLFDELQIEFDDDNDRVRLFNTFLRSFYLTTRDQGFVRRNVFYQASGMPQSAIDWTEWRNLTGSG